VWGEVLINRFTGYVETLEPSGVREKFPLKVAVVINACNGLQRPGRNRRFEHPCLIQAITSLVLRPPDGESFLQDLGLFRPISHQLMAFACIAVGPILSRGGSPPSVS
jgi:hypothetical protein